ncbi:hypothetical protein A6M21_15340 [Desulfotomaculum copahuensis]|uniref:Uncharacterized protein n=1 Tax=Desulfotomaculum copahuensis TaxID=1838280 RepID=A0A1B7LBD0_9FIRM|nr:hypothetical protein A6M21_15340 [Desulfotomaculum copahuensis]
MSWLRAAVLGLAAVLVFSLAGCVAGGPAQADKQTYSGLVNATEVDVNTKIPGRVIKLAVKEGGTVKNGQLLAEIDPADLLNQKKAAQAQLDAAAAAMQKAGAGLQAAAAGGEKAQAAADVTRGTAGATLAKAQAGLAKAQDDAALAKKVYQRIDTLHRQGAVPEQQYDEAKNKLDAANAAVQAAEDDVAAARAGLGQVDVYQAGVAEASAAKAASQADINAARAAYNQAQAQLQEIEANLAQTKVVAPVSGVITSRNVEAGEVAAAGASLFTLTENGHNWVDVKVPETALGKIKLHQKVTVTGDAFPGRRFTGEVTAINKKGDFATYRATNDRGDKDIIAFDVRVELDDPAWWPGMTAEVAF